jgi:bacterioferritin-associated ferredoxin
MIVCSCNCISSRDIEGAVDARLREDPLQVLTPGVVYRLIGKRPNCGACLSHASRLIQQRVTSIRHARAE